VAEHNRVTDEINRRAEAAREMEREFRAAVVERNERCADMVLDLRDVDTLRQERAARAKARAAAAPASAASAVPPALPPRRATGLSA